MKLNKETYIKYELGLTVIFFIYYLFLALNSQNVFSIYLFVVAGFTIASIVLVLMLLLFTKSKNIDSDERDKIIESKAYRNAFLSLIIVVNIVIIMSFVTDKVFEPFIIFNILFAMMFVSQIILNTTKIVYYKMGL